MPTPLLPTEPLPAAEAADVFILFNEQEDTVEAVVNALEAQGIRTFFWRRDIPVGTPWQEPEARQLRAARVVLLFLGRAGWGPTHLRLTQEAQQLGKYIIPVLLAEPPQGAKTDADELFARLRYVVLKELTPEALGRLVQALKEALSRPAEHASSADALANPSSTLSQRKDGRFDGIVDVFVNGDQPAQVRELEIIRTAPALDRVALAARLREEILGRFSPASETKFNAAIRAPGEIPLIRSWLLSALVQSDAEGELSRALLLAHLEAAAEPYQNARFWILSSLYNYQASYLADATARCLTDPEAQVATLARVISLPPEPESTEAFQLLRHLAESADEAQAWPVLRALRIVPVPALVPAASAQFVNAAPASSHGYDALYALASPPMAQAAATLLLGPLGLTLEAVLDRVVTHARSANATALTRFAGFLSVFDPAGVDQGLTQLQRGPQAGPAARELQRLLQEYRLPRRTQASPYLPGYQADTADATSDQLDIQEDVRTLTAVMLARDIQPPLAIGLFGDWGSGKSFFMKSMRQVTEQLTRQAAADRSAAFCTNVVSIEFNAWHYVDTNLWASLVSFILEKLDAHVSPLSAPNEQLVATRLELQLAQLAVADAEGEKQRVEAQITERRQKLLHLQREREDKQLKLSELRWQEFTRTLLPESQQTIAAAAEQLGLPQALASLDSLAAATAEAATVWGRLQALLRAIVSFRSLWWLVGLLLIVLVGIPWLLHQVQQHLPLGALLAWGAARVAQFTAFVAGLAGLLQGAVKRVGGYVHTVAEAKQRAERFLTQQQQTPSLAEQVLRQAIEVLTTQEQTATAGLSAAEARVAALEEHIRALQERQSLAHFLTERSQSDDYRKHLGLISTIRRDFEHLAERLKKGTDAGLAAHPIDRIVLYIDDLDRCPTAKVIEVLQAIHLLLAHELFVVVVGVDPRWLLHSLHRNFTPFQHEQALPNDEFEAWQTTPQNYLEKIFQIPFSLRPMAQTGYRQLMRSLLTSASTPSTSPLASATNSQTTAPPPTQVPFLAASINQAPLPEALGLPPATFRTELPEPMAPLDFSEPLPVAALTLHPWESQFAGELFALIPTPRAAKRFTNIYRLLKAQVRPAQLVQFEGSAAQPGEFQVPMLLLAMLIGFPAEAAVIFPQLQHHAESSANMRDAWQMLAASKLATANVKRVAAAAQLLSDMQSFPQHAAVYSHWLPRVARFSFELGRNAHPATTSLN